MEKDLLLFQDLENEHANYVRNKINEELEMVKKGIHIISKNIEALNNKLSQNITSEQRKEFEIELEKYIKLDYDFRRKYNNLTIDMYNIYICCSPHVRRFLLRMGSKLKLAMPEIEMSDIYIALILVAYSMLGEQYYDMIKIDKTSEETKKVFFGIMSGDIIYNDENLSAQIRRFFILNNNNDEVVHTMDLIDTESGMDVSHSSLYNESDYKTPPSSPPPSPPSSPFHSSPSLSTPPMPPMSPPPMSPPPMPQKRKAIQSPSSPPKTYKRKRTQSGGKKKRRATKKRK